MTDRIETRLTSRSYTSPRIQPGLGVLWMVTTAFLILSSPNVSAETNDSSSGTEVASTQNRNGDMAPFDLDGLIDRLRETPAIGLFAKLGYRHQLNELIYDISRRQGDGIALTHTSKPRREFDSIINGVLMALAEKDKPLHEEVSRYRGEIWLAVLKKGKE